MVGSGGWGIGGGGEGQFFSSLTFEVVASYGADMCLESDPGSTNTIRDTGEAV